MKKLNQLEERMDGHAFQQHWVIVVKLRQGSGKDGKDGQGWQGWQGWARMALKVKGLKALNP